MEAGRELDALVAEKVMGWKRHTLHYESAGDGFGGNAICEICDSSYCLPPWNMESINREEWCKPSLRELPSYSTDIAVAWQVVEKFRAEGIFTNLGQTRREPVQWSCYLWSENWAVGYIDYAETAPHAICLAALKALGIPV